MHYSSCDIMFLTKNQLTYATVGHHQFCNNRNFDVTTLLLSGRGCSSRFTPLTSVIRVFESLRLGTVQLTIAWF